MAGLPTSAVVVRTGGGEGGDSPSLGASLDWPCSPMSPLHCDKESGSHQGAICDPQGLPWSPQRRVPAEQRFKRRLVGVPSQKSRGPPEG